MAVVRRKLLGSGKPHDEVEALLATNAKPYPLLALALFDDEKRTNDVTPRLEKFGKWAPAALKGCQAGAHGDYAGDLETLVNDVGRLADQIAAVAK
jgi:hypothetical protein